VVIPIAEVFAQVLKQSEKYPLAVASSAKASIKRLRTRN